MLTGWIVLPLGIVVAAAASAIGIGGGILWMPVFLIGFGMGPESAVLSSLLIQTAGMGSGTVAFIRQQRADLRLAIFLTAFAAPGVAAGAMVTSRLAPGQLELVLGILTLTTALLFVSAHQRYADHGVDRAPLARARRYAWLVMLMSTASGLLSVSVGEWLIPLLRSKLSMRMGTAIATSIVVIFGTCVMGVMLHAFQGAKTDLRMVAWAIPGVLIGGQLGPRITHRINDRLLKEIFIFLLTLVGIHLIYNAF